MKQNLGQLIDDAWLLREQIRIKNAELTVLQQQEDSLKLRIAEYMGRENITQSRGGKATASLNSKIVPNAKDWAKVYAFIKKHGAFQLLERRMSAAAYREMLERRKGRGIPGVESFTKQDISLRTLDSKE